jgi:hypothetical protein
MTKITPAAALRCATHSLPEQLAQLRELERQRVVAESCDRILRAADKVPPVTDKDGGQ